MGKTKVKVKQSKQSEASKSKPRLIGSAQPQTIIHFKYNSKGQKRRKGWK